MIGNVVCKSTHIFMQKLVTVPIPPNYFVLDSYSPYNGIMSSAFRKIHGHSQGIAVTMKQQLQITRSYHLLLVMVSRLVVLSNTR